MSKKRINNLVVVSDIHSGCQLALCPPQGGRLDEGGIYKPNRIQKKMWAMWEEFWGEFVPSVVKDEPYDVAFNGDALEGVHHRATTQWTQNLEDQSQCAHQILWPIAEAARESGGDYYHVRGTEAHVGSSAYVEERLAKSLGAKPNEDGQYARYDLWKRVGPKLVHLLHHIGSTGSQAYEATAVHKELVEEFTEAARWGRKPPDIIVRSHRHRYIRTSFPMQSPGEKFETGEAMAIVTPCWQGKTPFVWKIPGGRLATPQFGGIVIRYHEGDGELYSRSKVWTVDRSREE